ncbi:unnamed protein product [Rhodiola kirilowii]
MEKIMFILFISFATIFSSGVDATKFTIQNNCSYTIWPATLGGNGQLSSTGFQLAPNASQTLNVPSNWSGRIWGRTGCATDKTTGKFTCQTADCGGNLQCAGLGGAPPLTLIELTLGEKDFYDVSLVDGFNLPVAIAPQHGAGTGCITVECAANVLPHCPSDQATKGSNGNVIGCLNPCNVFQTPEYCCTGAHATPETCPPSDRSKIFKNLCPQAYSYAYDDKTSTFTCTGHPDYVVTFCP